MREGTVSPLHTPGVYTTPVAFISAIALDWSIIVEVSDSQKQSINDAFQYVAVPPIARRHEYERCKDRDFFSDKLRFYVKTLYPIVKKAFLTE